QRTFASTFGAGHCQKNFYRRVRRQCVAEELLKSGMEGAVQPLIQLFEEKRTLRTRLIRPLRKAGREIAAIVRTHISRFGVEDSIRRENHMVRFRRVVWLLNPIKRPRPTETRKLYGFHHQEDFAYVENVSGIG